MFLMFLPLLVISLLFKVNKLINYEFKFNKKLAMLASLLLGALMTTMYTPMSPNPTLETIILMTTLTVLLNISIIDFERLEIPDTYNISIACLGLLNILFVKTHYLFFIIATISFLLFLSIALISKGSLGMGDVKLSFGLGLFLDILMFKNFILGTFLSGAALGLFLILIKAKGKEDKFAFGPLMAIGFLLTQFI